MKSTSISASLFSIVLGLSGLGQSWRVAARMWHVSATVGEAILLLATLVWCVLLIAYVLHALRNPAEVVDEFKHPVAGGTAALLGVSTLLIVQAVFPYSRGLAAALAVAGLAWHLSFALWHTGMLWQGGRDMLDTAPTLYLPTVAGNFTGAAALATMGRPEWGWLLFGAGIFSWLAIEPLIIYRLWHGAALPPEQRPLLGIQFAPPVVGAAAALVLQPGSVDHWIVMLLGYGLFQMLIGLRLGGWLTKHPFAPSWWAYTFGVASATLACMKLAHAGVPPAQTLSVPVFVGANLFIGYLSVRTLAHLFDPSETQARISRID
ncbi:tellurite resistance protein [Burkholderia sp. CF099]|nr:tellurite resistance protein [Burkholderia sp. CF099]